MLDQLTYCLSTTTDLHHYSLTQLLSVCGSACQYDAFVTLAPPFLNDLYLNMQEPGSDSSINNITRTVTAN